MPHKLIPLLAAAALWCLLLAIVPFRGYWVYEVSRIGISTIALLGCVALRIKWLKWALGIITALFNPFIPMHMSRGAWAVMDWIAAGVFFTAFARGFKVWWDNWGDDEEPNATRKISVAPNGHIHIENSDGSSEHWNIASPAQAKLAELMRAPSTPEEREDSWKRHVEKFKRDISLIEQGVGKWPPPTLASWIGGALSDCVVLSGRPGLRGRSLPEKSDVLKLPIESQIGYLKSVAESLI